ncbi:MAG: copper ion binding protein, partial [Actinomycetota bacterium]|nr:copper ion binding protein [Actinomycetota bacterium]
MDTTTTKQVYRISVNGMDCRSCERLLAKNIERIPGVDTASANAESGTLTILMDTSVRADTIAQAIVRSGFTPVGLSDGSTLVPVVDLAAEATAEAPVEALVASTEPGSTADAQFAITGMTCASCATVIEKTLAATQGVASAAVNLAAEKLTVTYDPSSIDIDRIIGRVHDAGYQAAAIVAAPAQKAGGHLDLAITGMTCASCSAIIEKVLGKLHGVTTAVVNLAMETASVDFDPTLVGPDEIIGAIKGAGYSVEIKAPAGEAAVEPEDGQRTAQQAFHAHQRNLFVFALVLSVPAFLVSMVPPFMTVFPLKAAEFLASVFGGAWDPMMVGKYLAFALATPVQFYAGAQFYRGFWHAIKRRMGNMDTLIAIGTSAAYFYSLVATFVPGFESQPIFYEVAALLITFVLLGKLLEASAKGKTSDAIKKL